jgi:thioredoxin:protein disulfide reductase
MALGMGVPLLLLGASAGHWLPRSGPWMYAVKRLFGVLLLAVALWTAQPLLPVALSLGLWGLLFLSWGLLLRPWKRRAIHHHPLRYTAQRVAAVAALLWGALQVLGAATGGDDPLQPLAHWSRQKGLSVASLPFRTVRSPAELDAALADAQGRVALLDFYADWCVACKEMERFTFSDSEVARRMSAALLLRVDVTDNGDEARALMKRFRLFQSATQFNQTLRAAGL